MPALVLTIRFHDGRYHGRSDWPPSPGRLFQALVAAAARGRRIEADDQDALRWLERLDPPAIAAPAKRPGQGLKNFVPNNDLDAVGGDPRRVGEIRAGKEIKPILFDAETPFLYVWTFPDDPSVKPLADRVCAIAERLYQLGRGVDMAWAVGEVADQAEAERRLEKHGGVICRPRSGKQGNVLAVPMPGSLQSLIERHAKSGERFQNVYETKPTRKEPDRKVLTGQLFSQPPKPRFRQVAYDAPPARHLYDLVDLASDSGRPSWPLHGAVELTLRIRDEAARRLAETYARSKDTELGRRAALVAPVLVGRGSGEADKPARVRITPIPSIGTRHTSPGIRRVLVEVPPDCPLPADDIAWAFSGLPIREQHDAETGEVSEQLVLARAADTDMLRHYAITLEHDGGRSARRRDVHRVWRTVTPAALPAARRRIGPAQLRAERARALPSASFGRGGRLSTEQTRAAKGGPERADEEARAAGAVVAALRHVGVGARVASVRVQREPFRAKGARAEAFVPPESAPGAPESLADAHRRFPKERLWHVEITFAEGLAGPLVIGDGRYLGLGLMAPPDGAERRRPDALAFEITPETRPAIERREAVVHALRRALMSRDALLNGGEPTTLFSGHDEGAGPAADGRHRHVYLYAEDADGDGRLDRIGVVAPWRVDRSWAPRPRTDREGRDGLAALFEDVTADLALVRAGAAGVLRLAPAHEPQADDPAFSTSQVWISRTPYRPTRHPKRHGDAAAHVVADVQEELRRRGLPRPEVEILALERGARGGLTARLKLRFATAVAGPILLGRDAHAGGGMFVAEDEASR